MCGLILLSVGISHESRNMQERLDMVLNVAQHSCLRMAGCQLGQGQQQFPNQVKWGRPNSDSRQASTLTLVAYSLPPILPIMINDVRYMSYMAHGSNAIYLDLFRNLESSWTIHPTSCDSSAVHSFSRPIATCDDVGAALQQRFLIPVNSRKCPKKAAQELLRGLSKPSAATTLKRPTVQWWLAVSSDAVVMYYGS